MHFCPEHKVLCLGQIQYNTLLSTTLRVFKHSGGCVMLWVWLIIVKNWGVFQDKNKGNGAKHRQNPRGKQGSVCFTPDTGR